MNACIVYCVIVMFLHFAVNDFSGGRYIYDDSATAMESHELPAKLSAVANEWMHIGVLLGVPFSWLTEKNGTPQENLSDTLREWLDEVPEATLQRLVEAVEHSAGGGNPAKAAEIKAALKKMIKGKHNSQSHYMKFSAV